MARWGEVISGLNAGLQSGLRTYGMVQEGRNEQARLAMQMRAMQMQEAQQQRRAQLEEQQQQLQQEQQRINQVSALTNILKIPHPGTRKAALTMVGQQFGMNKKDPQFQSLIDLVGQDDPDMLSALSGAAQEAGLGGATTKAILMSTRDDPSAAISEILKFGKATDQNRQFDERMALNEERIAAQLARAQGGQRDPASQLKLLTRSRTNPDGTVDQWQEPMAYQPERGGIGSLSNIPGPGQGQGGIVSWQDARGPLLEQESGGNYAAVNPQDGKGGNTSYGAFQLQDPTLDTLGVSPQARAALKDPNNPNSAAIQERLAEANFNRNRDILVNRGIITPDMPPEQQVEAIKKSWTHGPNFGPEAPRLGLQQKAAPALSESESKNTGFLARAQEGETALQSFMTTNPEYLNSPEAQRDQMSRQVGEGARVALGGVGTAIGALSTRSWVGGIAGGGAGGAIGEVAGPTLQSWLMSDTGKQYMASATPFVTAALRKDSGAQINDGEWKKAFAEWLPLPLDPPATIEQKGRNRQAAMQGMIAGSGRGPSRLGSQGEPKKPMRTLTPMAEGEFKALAGKIRAGTALPDERQKFEAYAKAKGYDVTK